MAQNESRFHLNLKDFGDVHGITHLAGREALSELFYYDIDFVIPNDVSKPVPADLVDTVALLTLDSEFEDNADFDGDSRIVHGVVQWMRFVRDDHRFHHYQMRLTPQLWRLNQTSDCRIYQKKDIQTVITEILKENGFAGDDYEFIFQETHPEREYCCQYRETHLEFLERLMAEEGIYYTFKHEAARHILVMADTPTVDFPIPGNDTLPFHPLGGGEHQFETISRFGIKHEIRTGKFTHTHYEFKKPALELEKEYAGSTHNKLARYDYNGRYVMPQRGDHLARFRLEEHKADEIVGSGQTNSVRMQSGQQFTLEKHELSTHNQKYLITQISIEAQQPGVLSEVAGTLPENISRFHCEFQTIPSDVAFRPPYAATKPQVQGPHVAEVVGPAGEEIYVDEYGRVKVQFKWDRYGKSDEFSSVWMRVSQGWAGAAWGSMFIPRIGHEVIVDFLEGDIDQPLITGRVYHATNVPPYPLPANKTISTIKSQTHKGAGSNELRFEDEAGKEEVYIHAQKDETIKVENDKTENIGHDETIGIVNDRTENVGHDETISIGNNRTHSIDNDDTETVTNNQAISIGKDQTMEIGSNQNITVTKDESISVGQNQTISTGQDQTTIVGANRSASITTNDEVSVGGTRMVQSEGDMTILSSTNITISVGGSSIAIGPGTIDISSGKVTINGSLVKIN